LANFFASFLGRDRSSASDPGTTYLDGRLNKAINKAGEDVPVSELAIARGACSATALHNDEFDDLLLEVVVLNEVQSTAEKGGSTRQ